MRGVGGEALLGVEGPLQAGEHGVEGVGEIGELVARTGESDAVVQGAVGRSPGSSGDVLQGPQDAPRDEPAADDPDERQQEQREAGGFEQGLKDLLPGRGAALVPRVRGGQRVVGHETHGQVDDGQGERARDDHEQGVSEGELHPGGQPPRPKRVRRVVRPRCRGGGPAGC